MVLVVLKVILMMALWSAETCSHELYEK